MKLWAFATAVGCLALPALADVISVAQSDGATPAVSVPTVTYTLSKNDDGQGHFSDGNYAVYATSSVGNNAGISAFEFNIQGYSTLTNVSPTATYVTTVVQSEGFSLNRTPAGVSPTTGSQDLANVPNGTVRRVVYGLGQTAGSLDSGSVLVTQANYAAKLLLATGTYDTQANGLAFVSGTTFDQANVFSDSSSTNTLAANVAVATQTVAVPEPTTVGLVVLVAGGLVARRRRRA